MAEPFSGLLVVSLEQAVAAPLCSSRLADGGARVIKVERPEGDFARGYDHVVNGGSAYFDWLNRGKESLVADFKQPDDAALLRRMIGRADIFIQNLVPGAAERAGLGSDTLRRLNPRLITCDISGYGADGPLRLRKAYDLLVQCETGLASITGTPDAPGRVGISIVDLVCGLNAYAGILEALALRERTGAGSGIAVSLFDAMADFMAVPLLHHDYGGKGPDRVGIAHPSIVPYGVYRCGDGTEIVIAVQNEREWQNLAAELSLDAATLSDPRFASNSARTQHRPEVDAVISAVFSKHSAPEIVALLERANLGFAFVNDVAALSAHPHLRRITLHSPEGPLSLSAPPIRWAERTVEPGPVPALGAHSESVRLDFAKEAGA